MQADWRPSSPVATAARRAQMLDAARRFFAERAVLEVDTPLLSPATVSDPHIESIAATLGRKPGRPYFLQTSPEFFMKRLLCAGYPDIYQICKAFRDGEAGRRHSPEFTLVEWYRRGFALRQMMDETVAFIAALIEPRRLTTPPEFMEYRDAFGKYADVDPQQSSLAALADAAGADRRMIRSLGDDRDAWLDLVLTARAVPQFASGRLTVLYHYPASQAALARLCPVNAALADRFEVFYGDLELANGFVELQDAHEQARRLERDRSVRRQREQPVHSTDRRLIAALEAGLPECAGVAVGFDRLLMINEISEDIRQVQSFAFDGDDA
jgi:lysyl-tRNA synthetase class 2